MKKAVFLFSVLSLLFFQACGSDRTVVVDITQDLICKGELLTDVSGKCLSREGCNEICASEGCSSYDMSFVSSEFSNGSCRCVCVAENNIRKVARYYNTDGRNAENG